MDRKLCDYCGENPTVEDSDFCSEHCRRAFYLEEEEWEQH